MGHLTQGVLETGPMGDTIFDFLLLMLGNFIVILCFIIVYFVVNINCVCFKKAIIKRCLLIKYLFVSELTIIIF